MDRLSLCDPARRPRESTKVIMASPALEIEEHILRQHAVTLTAADRTHSTTPADVGKEPLSDGDIAAFAKLICLDQTTLKIAGAMAEVTEAEEAVLG
ncbi:Auxin-induced protein 5NG4 [Hordeum vulgare]|nr:Auxin-induced protein 5NG4 [Hordeum vulgare]